MNTVTVKNVTLGSGSPKIIVPLVGKNETELIEEAKHLVTIDCDLVEWRVDFFDQVTNFEAAALMSKKLPKFYQINLFYLPSERNKKVENLLLQMSNILVYTKQLLNKEQLTY